MDVSTALAKLAADHSYVRPEVDSSTVRSDLRFMIEKALAEAGIAVPYPQRDVHLDASAPLRVEVMARAEPQALPRQSRG